MNTGNRFIKLKSITYYTCYTINSCFVCIWKTIYIVDFTIIFKIRFVLNMPTYNFIKHPISNQSFLNIRLALEDEKY